MLHLNIPPDYPPFLWTANSLPTDLEQVSFFFFPVANDKDKAIKTKRL